VQEHSKDAAEWEGKSWLTATERADAVAAEIAYILNNVTAVRGGGRSGDME
jgi:hypothetical protein